MRSLRILIVVLMIVLASPVSKAGASVAGHLEVGGATVSPSQAMAMWEVSRSFWDKGEKMVAVILANSPMSDEGIDQALDREAAIRQQIEGDFIIMSIHKDGKLGVYVYIDEGAKNYGFDGGTAAIASQDDGRIAGRLFTDGKESIGDTPIEFDLSFDVVILPDRKPGSALPAGGGAVGTAYLAYVKAMRDGDVETIIKHAPIENSNYIKEMDKEWLKYKIESMQESAPKEMKVSGGEMFNGFAFLKVAGQDAYDDKVEGQVKMVLDGEIWRFDDEDLNRVW